MTARDERALGRLVRRVAEYIVSWAFVMAIVLGAYLVMQAILAWVQP